MPSKNTIKNYIENGFYHIYNRGVEQRIIFNDELDYTMFLSYLKNYLIPPYKNQTRPIRRSDLYEKIKLLAYCLMPNHFHLLIEQSNSTSIISFMRCLSNAYTNYFNRRNNRVGPLFQGRYKAVLVTEDPYLLHLTRYIHLNPCELSPIYRSDLLKYSYSSYAEYLGRRKTSWIHSEEILAFFKTAKRPNLKDILSYQSFVEDSMENPRAIIKDLTLDSD